MKYGIVAFPSKEIQDFANSYRKRYDTHYAKITPHITLKGETEIQSSEIEEISASIKKVCEQFNPLTISISKISSFAPVNNAIYLKVEPTEQLMHLHEALENDVAGGEAKYKFVPHITIAQDMSAGEHDDVFGQLRMTKVDFNETINRIHLLYQLEDGSWTVFETYRLRGEE
ncbi:YjcG family protein [Rummeliibacillus stabekisii]|uniref:YjcG family protein n=1 Tax=Rummeliibacillus stabekisii TaxID=241244 RepID=UPI0011666855|nr:YjcG family protein [Rummeliibacillus stabekisii]MBB5170090.1 2'-5' RNA ligase [Rummeliibacillus stabekisii]GEL04349.1 putative phosphoesterase YjcG [Rummeliibacillus stabekisii]